MWPAVDDGAWFDGDLGAARVAYDRTQELLCGHIMSDDTGKSRDSSGSGRGLGEETKDADEAQTFNDGKSDGKSEGKSDGKSDGKSEKKADVPSPAPAQRAWRLACMEEARGSGSLNPDHAFLYLHHLAANVTVADAIHRRFDAAVRLAYVRKENQLGALRILLCETIPINSDSNEIPLVTLEQLHSAGLALT